MYTTLPPKALAIERPNGTLAHFDSTILVNALPIYQEKINLFYANDLNIAEILGMRNLSGAIGEIYVLAIAEASAGLFIKNPNQDGYPDLLLMDTLGQSTLEAIRQENLLQEKARFSPFSTGGIEVKATCGSVPSQKECNKKEIERPNIGNQRIDCLRGYDWKAHHRETNNLVGITWDFINGIPCITSVQYSALLTQDAWGNIVQPSAGGGRTTSVSIMTRAGVATMYNGTIAVLNDNRYKNFFNKYNKGTLLS